jgi:hypothetical protein
MSGLRDQPAGGYPNLYHRTMAALLWQDTPLAVARARNLTADLLRHYRRYATKAHMAELLIRLHRVGWPLRRRPDGTLR